MRLALLYHQYWKITFPSIYYREFSRVTANTFLHCLRNDKTSPQIAVSDHSGNYAYKQLHEASDALSQRINGLLSKEPQQRIATLLPNNFLYPISLLATWKSGHTFVPLSQLYPETQLEYFLKDSEATLLVATEENESKVRNLSQSTGVQTLILNPKDKSQKPLMGHPKSSWFFQDGFLNESKALIVYTSGTTGPPKGVVLSHVNIHHQVEALIHACGITKSDIILHTLPLHHVHGIIAALLSVLAAGGSCVMLPKFNAKQAWQKLIDSNERAERVNLFMAVPTIYAKLIEEFDYQYAESSETKDYIRAACKEKIRLMTSGSASLPDTVLERLQEITGHGLQERYGLSEVGSALSNPLEGQRRAGSVGTPMYGYEVRIAKPNFYTRLGYDIICHSTSSSQTTVTPGTEGEVGELHIKGPAVFAEYWDKPQETKAAFTHDGWFKTGDTFRFEDGAYRIVGRTSVDVIKNGGYKISALDVERALLSHELVSECAVVGLPDMTWGQRVAAVVVLKTTNDQQTPKVDSITDNLRQFCRNKLPTYSVPTIITITDAIHKNAMGKVNKKDLIKRMFKP